MAKDRLFNIFQQFGGKNLAPAPENLKDAVFSTIDAAALAADILDLFTVKFIQAQAELLDMLPSSEYGNEQQMLYNYFKTKFESGFPGEK